MNRTDDITLEELQDFKLLIECLISQKKTGCAYPTVLKTGHFKANNKFYEYMDTDSVKECQENHLTVRTLRTFMEDNQTIFITAKDTYFTDEGIYFGYISQAPEHLMSKRISKFYSDYVPTHGSFIGIRIIE